jgi:hypothetical protein
MLGRLIVVLRVVADFVHVFLWGQLASNEIIKNIDESSENNVHKWKRSSGANHGDKGHDIQRPPEFISVSKDSLN